MQNFPSTHMPEKNGTPYANPSQAGAVLVYKGAMPIDERDHLLQDERPPMRVEPDGKRQGRGTILSVGDDLNLLKTRHLVLQSAGHETYSLPGNALIDDDVISTLDLAIICHSVDERQAAVLIASLRKVNPSLPIIWLTTALVRQPGTTEEVAVLWATEGPQTLLAQIHSILTGYRKSATGSQE
jgi:hypothetical protein